MGYSGGGPSEAERQRMEAEAAAAVRAHQREEAARIEANRPENIPTAVVGGKRSR